MGLQNSREVRRLRRLIAVARGEMPADLVLSGGRVANVFTGELLREDVAIVGDRIAGLGRYTGRAVRHVDGGVIAPGLVDAHLHLESTMLTPAAFARAVVPRGTTAVVMDPHEIGNVAGAWSPCGMGGSRRGCRCPWRAC
jgi:adenine deaminase